MATRGRIRRHDAQLGYDAITIEAGLLAPEWLAKVGMLQAGGQSEPDYRVPKGLTLRDEIGRYWRIAQALWADMQAGLNADADRQALADRFGAGFLRDVLGFGSLQDCASRQVAGRVFPVRHAAVAGRVPVVIAPAASGLDALDPRFGDGSRRRSAFGLLQELLNGDDTVLWGVATDGLTLRLARDNSSLTRPAWIEADLSRIFTEELYSDFAALWLLAHETRFGAAECALERWREAGREEGTRAREHLRDGVEKALLALGQGFLAQADNKTLRSALGGGTLSKEQYFQELLRLVYRLIFLLTVEERGLLHPAGAPAAAVALYQAGYGLQRLRDRAVKRNSHDGHFDLWEGVKVALRGLARGEPTLSLPALGGLFAANQCPHLDSAKLENRALLGAMLELCWLRDDAGLSRVNWRDMGPEELGSVYESLLELVPQVLDEGRKFAFAVGAETKGNARKTTGSYYTPDDLVRVLLDTALEPVVQATIAAHPAGPAPAVLDLTVVDPACGSGHFLLAAARRLATHVARLEVNGTPSATEYRHALRRVVGRCVYGVDLNPMAVELCKVSLWMEAVEPGLPLTFLDSHIRLGNALLGTTPDLMRDGVPDAAWEPIEGDDRKTASALKKRNKKAAEGQRSLETLWSKPTDADEQAVARAIAELEVASDASPGDLASKESKWQAILESEEYRHQKLVADAWCAAFVWPKQPGELADAAPTNDVWRQLRDGQGRLPALTTKTASELAERYRFFHWPLQFPQVFSKGGFDIVLGNPPWERIKLQEQEFFAARDDAIAGAPNAAARKGLVSALATRDPVLWREWCEASREAEGQSQFVRGSGRYPLCGKGDLNTYAVFAEHNRAVVSKGGRAGFVVPTGIATDDTTKEYFGALVDNHELASFFGFENEEFIFPAVHHAFKFALLTVDHSGGSRDADLLFFARRVDALSDAERHLTLSAGDFVTLSPNTRTCPTFRSRRDADLNLSMYRRTGVLCADGIEAGNPWAVEVRTRLWHMAEDSAWFKSKLDLLAEGWTPDGPNFVKGGDAFVPLIEAKMVHHFDHRFGTYAGQSVSQGNQGKLPELDDDSHADPTRFVLPWYWVPAVEVSARLSGVSTRPWLLGWRDICRSTDQRTVIASVMPRVAVGHTLPLLFTRARPDLVLCLYASLCSFAVDYAARQKVGGTHLTFSHLKQLPVLRPDVFAAETPWCPGAPLASWALPRILELTYTAWDLEALARDVGYAGPPFRWDSNRRFLLRAELDAAFLLLYGLAREDAEYVMNTFPVVRANDEKAHGEYRTKRIILEIYDAMVEATRTGKPYETRLDPPPADPRVAHHPSSRPRGGVDAIAAELGPAPNATKAASKAGAVRSRRRVPGAIR